MDSDCPLLIPLDAAGQREESIVGGKAAKLAQLARAGFKVPRGFCLTTRAYETFLKDARITTAIRMELDRKPMDEMRGKKSGTQRSGYERCFSRIRYPICCVKPSPRV